jgi:hypothetical protein
MGDLMTPVEAAKKLDIRPQQVYGFIKHGRLSTKSNPAGKASLVDLEDVRRLVQGVRHHREKDPTTGKPKRKDPKVKTGTILSMHGKLAGTSIGKNEPHRVKVVTGIVDNDEGDPSLVVTSTGDGTHPMYWEAETLAERIGKRACHIESPENLLGVLMFHFVHNEKPELAAALDLWIQAQGELLGEVPTITEQ